MELAIESLHFPQSQAPFQKDSLRNKKVIIQPIGEIKLVHTWLRQRYVNRTYK